MRRWDDFHCCHRGTIIDFRLLVFSSFHPPPSEILANVVLKVVQLEVVQLKGVQLEVVELEVVQLEVVELEVVQLDVVESCRQ